MREKLLCRRCESVSRSASLRRPFAVPGALPHYAPDLPVKLEHILLDVSVDPKARTFKGTVTQRIRVIAPDQKRLRLDQIGIIVEEARVDGKPARHALEGNHLYVDLASAPAVGDTLEIAVRYQLKAPKRGLYFTGPDAAYPNKPCQVWSQGQDEDTRHWIPTFDYPNQKATTEVIATVPKGFTAVSNGALLSKKDVPEGTRFHYKLGTPHVTYLITLSVAEFSEWADAGPGGVPVQYFVAPGREEDGRRAFGNTPRMIEAYAAKIGVPYPYEKYSQVAVQDFIFGGMENTSATTQTDRTLHDARAHLDFSSDPLVSHELAHQWFGDLLTCRDWSHGWLNEGFATFMERVWIEANGKDFGGEAQAGEEAKYYSYADLVEYQEEDAKRYRRSIVSNTYLEPIDLFDAHLYQKGGLVLNLLRAQLGEAPFWKSINLYVNRHRGQSVETLDLIRAIEESTGRNLRRFFDEWVFGGGHPDFEVSYSWHDDKKMAEVTIEQKQTGGRPSYTDNGVTTHLFHLPVTLELTLEGGRKVTHRIEVGEAARDRLFLPAESKPLMVRFDPGATIPKTLKFPRPKELLAYQLHHDADCMGRIEAAKELIKLTDADVAPELAKALLADKFWGAQAEIAGALAELRTDAARDALVAALGIPHPKARRAVVKALGAFKDDVASAALRKHAEKDASYFVESDATRAWAGTQVRPSRLAFSPAAAKEVEAAEKFLLAQLAKPSAWELIRAAALDGLADLPGVGRGERPNAVAALIDWSRRGKEEDARIAAVMAIGKVARTAVLAERARLLEVLDQLADEDGFRLRMALIRALAVVGSSEVTGILDKIHRLDIDGRVRRNASSLREGLLAPAAGAEALADVKGALEKIEEEHRKLKGMVEEYRGLGKK